MIARSKLIANPLSWIGRFRSKPIVTATVPGKTGGGAGSESILLNTMPKSGSVYIAKSLQKILGFGFMHIGNRYALIDQIDVQEARTFAGGGYISQNHLAPSPENLQILRHLNLKMVLHVRDPREAMLSWTHHLDRVSRCCDESDELLYSTPRPPMGYFGLSFSRKLDWQIENYLPNLVSWAQQWIDVADRGAIPILLTQQSELRCNEKGLFEAILAFFQVSIDFDLPNLPRTLEETHFRRADPTEWRRTLTEEQAARASAAIPDELGRRFGWSEQSTMREVA
jgi:hypothetical protein